MQAVASPEAAAMPISSEQYMSNLLSSALMYASGNFPVFPLHAPLKKGLCDCWAGIECDSPAKHPRTPNGFKDASCDELTVRRWWKDAPRANIGLSIPSGYVVLDVDGQEGLDALQEAGYDLSEITPTASTGKGWHYWYKTETDLPPRAHMLPKVDLRGPGSYVVAPPSLHATGRQYRWIHGPENVEFQPAPDWLVELAKRPASAGANGSVNGHIDVAAVLSGIPEGRRDMELFRAASKMRYADMPYEWALQAILEAAEKCVPPFPAAAAQQKVDSAYGRYQPSIDLEAGEGTATLVDEHSVRVELTSAHGPVQFLFSDIEKLGSNFEAQLTVNLLAPGTSTDSYDQHINLLSHSARDSCRRELESIFDFPKGVVAKLLNRAFSEVKQFYLGLDRSRRVRDIPAPSRIDYVIDGVVLEDRPTMIFGAGSASKTWLVMSMMLAMSRGMPWLGRRTQQRNSLLIDFETGASTVGYRLRRLALGMGFEDVPLNIHHWWSDGTPIQDQAEAIKRCIDTNNIGFIAIDHCGAATGIEPEKSEAALRFYRTVTRWKLPVVGIAHITGDAETNPNLVRRPYGSIYWNNGAGMTWYIRREDQEDDNNKIEVGLFSRKANDSSRQQDFGLTLRFEGETGPIHLDNASLRNSFDLTASRGAKYMIDQVLIQPMTVEEIADATGLPFNTIKKTLQRNNRMFESVNEPSGGRGHGQVWQRVEHSQHAGQSMAESESDLSEPDMPWA